MKFDAVDLTQNGNISYSIERWSRSKRPFLSVIHLSFAGDYRDGSGGAPDAHFIRGITRTVNEIWRPSAMILDLRAVKYEWGDEMDLVLDLPTKISAIVVGGKCEPAISTLLYGLRTNKSVVEEANYFDALDPAIDFVAQALVDDWNSRVEEDPKWFSKSDLITIDELRRN